MPPRKPVQAPHRLADTDDHRQRLVALRDRLTAELATAPPAYLAGIARQLQSTLEALAALPPNTEGSPLEVLKARAAERMSAAGVPAAPRRTPKGST